MCIYIHKLRVHCSFHANWCVFQTTHSSYTMRQPISPSRSRFEFIFWIICQAKYCVVRYRIYVLIRIINIFLSTHTYLHALLHVPMQKKVGNAICTESILNFHLQLYCLTLSNMYRLSRMQ